MLGMITITIDAQMIVLTGTGKIKYIPRKQRYSGFPVAFKQLEILPRVANMLWLERIH